MLKKMFEYVVGLSDPTILREDGYAYSDKELYVMPRESSVKEPVHLSTLSGLLDYIYNAGTDLSFSFYMIQVVSPTQVRLLSPLDKFGKRDVLAVAEAEIPDFYFDRYMDSENFLIGVRAKFLETDDRELVVKFAGSAEKKTLQSYKDDGISQKVTVSSGIASREEALVPTIVSLMPYSTFTEVSQPSREFIFRMRDDGASLSCALFEADGGAWCKFAIWGIRDFLEKALKEFSAEKKIVIIA